MRVLLKWLEDRFGVIPIRENVLDRPVPKAPWYFGDGAALALLLVVLIVTGIIMALNYSASPDTAYESVRHLTEEQWLGWFIRALHYWAAGFMVVIIFLHMCRQILLGGYKFPREGTWLIGVLLFFAVLLMSYTGYLLRWDARALYGLKVSLHMLHNVPLVGEHLVVIAQGGTEVGARTLSRIFAIHVVIVPMLILFLVGWHLYLVILHGVTTNRERKQPVHTADEQRKLYQEQASSEQHGEKFHPGTSTKSGLMAVTICLIVIVVAFAAGPATLMTRADLVHRVFPAEEWWFWWYSGLIALLPPRIAPTVVVVLPIAIFIVLIALPFVDRGPRRGLLRRPVAIAVVLIVLIALIALTDHRRRSPWTAWPSTELPPIPENVTLAPEAREGHILFSQLGCNTCHSISGHGWQFGPDLARIPEVRSRAEMKEYILSPPDGIAMPSYEGRISEAELGHLLDFIHAAQAFPRE